MFDSQENARGAAFRKQAVAFGDEVGRINLSTDKTSFK